MTVSPVTPTLGTYMKQRRAQIELTQTRAAEQAGVVRPTWSNWERDVNVPEAHNYARIERVLRWEPGSVAATLEREQPPTPIPPTPADPTRAAEQDLLRDEMRALRAEAAAALARADALEARLAREAARNESPPEVPKSS